MARKLVLVVDDDDDVRQIVAAVVAEQFGVSVVGASDAESALALLHAVPPDAILLDARMPQGDGFGFLERLAAALPDRTPPVVMLSAASAHEGVRERALALGCVAFVRKPFDLAELTDALGRWLGAPSAERAPDGAA